jgi:DNA-binding response OmpR family regulator
MVRSREAASPDDASGRCRTASTKLHRASAREDTELTTHPDILVIEDDVQLQTTIEAALEDEGLQPAIAASGEEAVTLLKSDLSDYRALVVDIRLLGRIDGWEVARAARRIDPDLPVVYITGAAAERWETQGVPESVLLKKPFAPADLVTVIRQLLDGASNGEP